MVLIINTTAQKGELLLKVYDHTGILLLTLKDTAQGKCLIDMTQRYRIAWKTWSNTAATYRIETEVETQGLCMSTFKFFKSYPVGCSEEDETEFSV